MNICRKGSLLSSGKYWRNGFVTFRCEKEALHAKTALNDNRSSAWCGLISFARAVTVTPYVSNKKDEPSLPRLASDIVRLPGNVLFLGAKSCNATMLDKHVLEKILASRFGGVTEVSMDAQMRSATVTFQDNDVAKKALAFFASQQSKSDVVVTMAGHRKPTLQVYLHNEAGQTTRDSVEKWLQSVGVEQRVLKIFIGDECDYALVTFENLSDAQHFFYSLMAVAKNWVLDFETINDKTSLQVLLQAFKKVHKAEKSKMIEMAESGANNDLRDEIVSLQARLRETSDALTSLVQQSLRQAQVVAAKQDAPRTTER